MLHAKFQDHRTISSVGDVLKVVTIYGHGDHPGHVVWTICINFFPLPEEAPHESWRRLAKRFQRDDA